MEKLTFMLLSPIWFNVEDLKRKFKYLVRKTFPGTCDRIGFKFYKKQMSYENHDICHDIMISYVDAVIKNWDSFAKVVTYVGYEIKNLEEV